MRFLTDYLQGDIYFRTHRAGQNVDRCRVQFKMVTSISENEELPQFKHDASQKEKVWVGRLSTVGGASGIRHGADLVFCSRYLRIKNGHNENA